jgi:NAD(P)-dependent dehydrogenase (short-subunit alcohol dehydrogenase family)
MQNDQKKVAIVIGASRGIGAASAAALARKGAAVALTSRDLAACEALASQLRAEGFDAIAEALDVRDAEQTATAVNAVAAHYGRIDQAFINAGVLLGGSPLQDTPLTRFRETVDTNLGGVFHCLRALIPVMSREPGGAIVVNSAGSGLRGRAMVADYAASKWGAIGLALSAAQETGPNGLRINVIAPGYVGTDAWMGMLGAQAPTLARRVPLGRIGAPEEVADVVAWLLSDEARYVHGVVVPIDGGLLTG